MKVLRNILIAIVVFISYYTYHNFFTKNNIVGEYIVVDQQIEPFLSETPYTNHNLILYKDFSFISSYWGKGTYTITNSMINSWIHLNCIERKSSHSSRIKRQFFSPPRIILDVDLNHYMEKTD